MNILKKLLDQTSQPFDLVFAVERHETKRIIRHLECKTEPKNPMAIPYTADAIAKDLDLLYEYKKLYSPTRDEFAAAIATKMLHLVHKSTIDWLSKRGFSAPSIEHLTYIHTLLTTMQTLRDFKDVNIKKYKVSSCKDQRVCSVCSKQDGKVHMVKNAVIGKSAPPFCEKCRCIIMPIFTK